MNLAVFRRPRMSRHRLRSDTIPVSDSTLGMWGSLVNPVYSTPIATFSRIRAGSVDGSYFDTLDVTTLVQIQPCPPKSIILDAWRSLVIA